jgi:hypothetical protein
MKAISRLRLSGLTTAQIAEAINDQSRGHLVRAYEKFNRFPSKRSFVCLVELAESRGITLLARDFLASREACEPEASKRG